MANNVHPYTDLVAKYSKTYYRRMSDLFELEDIAQELWLLLLDIQNKGSYKAEKGAKETTFLISCIRNHMINLIIKEVRERRTVFAYEPSENTEAADEINTPESLVITKQIIGRLQVKMEKIKHADFVVQHMGTHSVREIADLAKQEGIKIRKSTVHNVVQKIRKMVEQNILK